MHELIKGELLMVSKEVGSTSIEWRAAMERIFHRMDKGVIMWNEGNWSKCSCNCCNCVHDNVDDELDIFNSFFESVTNGLSGDASVLSR